MTTEGGSEDEIILSGPGKTIAARAGIDSVPKKTIQIFCLH